MSFGGGGGGGGSLSGDTDVAFSTKSDGDLLTYVAGDDKWENIQPSSGSTVLDLVAGTTSLVNSTTFIPISGFAITGAATDDIWHLSGEIIYDADPAADIKFKVNAPANSIIYGRMTGIDPSANSVDATHKSVPITSPNPNNVTATFGAIGVGNLAVVTINIRVVVGGNGTFDIRFAQANADASTATIEGGSWILAARAASS